MECQNPWPGKYTTKIYRSNINPSTDITKRLAVPVEMDSRPIALCVSVLLQLFIEISDPCIVYRFTDGRKLLSQVEDTNRQPGSPALSKEDKARLTVEIREVIRYCRDIMHCRRVQLLRYFDQDFAPENCHQGCDVCTDESVVTIRDVTKEATDAIDLFKSLSVNRTAASYFKAIFLGQSKGRVAKGIAQSGHEKLLNYSKGKTLGSASVDKLFEELHVMDVLPEIAIPHGATGNWYNFYISVSYNLACSGSLTICCLVAGISGR